MQVVVSSRHMTVSPAIKQHAEAKAGKLTRYYDRIQEIEVVVDSADKGEHSVEVIVNAEHRALFVAKDKGVDAYTCINNCVNKLERQLTDHKEHLRNRKHPE
jgi:putative sigma-54 modulation protein